MIDFFEVKAIFGSQMKALEILILLFDEKKVVRHLFEEKKLEKVKEFCLSLGLHLEESTFKVVIVDTDKTFSNKGRTVSRDNPVSGLIAAYISKDEVLCLHAKYYELIEDHMNLGLVLGYPSCCVEFFVRENPIRKNLDNNYLIPGLKNSKGDKFSFYLNYFLRAEDIALLSHFPCNYNCSASLLLAKKALSVLKRVNAKLALEFENKLKQKLIIDGREICFS